MYGISIGEVILPGSLISIRVADDNAWSLNIAYRCDGDLLDVPLTQDIVKWCLFINSKVIVKFKNEQNEYLLQGFVSKIDISSLPYIRVKIIDCQQNTNNRMFPRRDVMFPASVTVPSNKTYFCIVSNISLGGVSFLVDQDIPTENECELSICLDSNETIYAKGIVIKNRYRGIIYEFRMQFTYMNEEHSTVLHNCMHHIEESFDTLREKYLKRLG